jgi:hypothetical protein
MSSVPSPSSAAPGQQRGIVRYVVAGCALIIVCLLCALAVGGAYFFTTQRTVATSAGVPSVEYILDATARMALPAAGENDTRLNVARGVLADIVRPSDPALTAGLRVFGTGAQSVACKDTSLVVPLASANQTQISTHLLSLTSGSSATAARSEAMISAIRDLAALKGKHTLVVVTGGADSCNPQAGELIVSEAKRANIDLQTFVVGYQVPAGDGTAIQGLVDSSGGTYVSADTKEKLTDVLTTIQQYAQDPKATSVSPVVATAVAAVGTQNVVVGGTPVPVGTPVPGSTAPGSSSTPAATAVAAGTSTGGGGRGSGGTGQTACDHPDWPMRPGATWTFSSDSGDQVWTILDVTGDKSNATATMQFKAGDVTGTYHWSCSAAGIDSYDFGSVSTGGNASTVTYQVVNHAGTFLPSADKLVKGAQWDSSYTMKGTVGSVTITDDVAEHFTLVGAETVTVLGKTLDALRVDITSNFAVSGSTGNTSFSGTSSYWLVQGIGPVQWQSTFGGTTSKAVVTSYSIP